VSVTVDGWKLQVAFCGRFVQENCNVPVYPPTEVSVRVSVTELPADTVREVVLGAMVTGRWDRLSHGENTSGIASAKLAGTAGVHSSDGV
jgi:hypothetical protein